MEGGDNIRKLDLTDRRFGKLVVKDIAPNKNGHTCWLCECDCGNRCVVTTRELTTGDTKSCGCYRKPNDFRLFEDFGKIIFSRGIETVFDIEDYDFISRYHWSLNRDHVHGRVDGRTIPLANYILECNGVIIPDGYIVDHINNNPLYNRKINLRVCSVYNNTKNRKPYKNNYSGYSGVRFSTVKNKWQAYIRINKKLIHLGFFEDMDDAVHARLEAEQKYFGEFSPNNI